ncbi:MAG: alpha/beta hydrolase [Clostridia bacterium]|nr:alpha/beta hydrolase [Deltaproteobacteria bacterium]
MNETIPQGTALLASKEITVRVPGLTLRGKEWGNPAASHKVLAIHGWLDNAASYDTLAPMLRGVHLVALDLPGHGLSEHRSENDTYHFIDWIPDVAAAADALGFAKFSLMGHSMGAAIAGMTAGTIPERIASVVLFDGIAPFTCAAADAPDTLAEYIKQRTRLNSKTRPTYASIDAALRRLQKVARVDEAALRLLTARNTREEGGYVVWTYDDRLRRISPMRFTEEHNLAFLERITCPVLFIRPRQGFPIDEAMLDRWQAAIKDVRRLTPEGSHHVHLEYPERVAVEVQSFLEENHPL